MTEQTLLPPSFTFKDTDDPYNTYTATSIGNDLYAVTWRESDGKAYRMTYAEGRVIKHISNGEWAIVVDNEITRDKT